jgi:nicotinamide-nucleotide amidase
MLHKDTITHEDKVRLGNIKARTRMVFLYNKAQEQKGLVLSTDNLTEYYLGFWTLHGDVGDLGLIQELWKTEVYGMGEVLGGPVLECVNANPTDGLGITDSDIDQLFPKWKPEHGDHRVAYNIVDKILQDHLTGAGAYSEGNPIIQRYEATKFKRANPVNIKRDMLLWVHSTIV